MLTLLSARARQAGTGRFTAEVAPGNGVMARRLRNGGACLTGRGPGTVEYEVALEPVEYSLDWRFRWAQNGTIAGWW